MGKKSVRRVRTLVPRARYAGSGSGHGDPAHLHRAVFIFFICETSDARAAASDQKKRKKSPNISSLGRWRGGLVSGCNG